MSAIPRRAALRALTGMSFAALVSCGGDNAPSVATQAGSARTPTAFGSQIYESDGIAQDVGLLTGIGAKYLRVSVQVSQPFLDAAVRAATAAGLRVILLSAYPAFPLNVSAYARDAAQLHARYASHNPIWEIWNEPNLPQFWADGRPNTSDYVGLFSATAQALRAAGATDVWTGGTSGVDLNWIFNLQTKGAFKWANGCAVHSYRPPGFAQTEYLQATLLIPAGVRLHTTETCVPSSSDQASFFNQMWSIHRGLNLPTMVWCELRDGGAGTTPPSNEDYGLVNVDYTTKPVYAAAKNAIVAQ